MRRVTRRVRGMCNCSLAVGGHGCSHLMSRGRRRDRVSGLGRRRVSGRGRGFWIVVASSLGLVLEEVGLLLRVSS